MKKGMLAVMGVPFNVFGFVPMIPAGCHGTNRCKSLIPWLYWNQVHGGFLFPFCGFKSLAIFFFSFFSNFFRIFNIKKIPIFFIRLSVKILTQKNTLRPTSHSQAWFW